MEIKKIESEDLQATANLLRSYWKERGDNYAQDFALNYLTNGHKTEITKDQSFVIKEKDKIVWMIALVVYEGNVAEIKDCILKKEARGKGWGRKLTEIIIDHAKRNEIRKISIVTVPNLRSFYEKFGFTLEGFLKDHFKEGEHMLIMSKKLKEKEDKQVDLKKKLEDEQQLQEIESETTDRLMKLRLR